MTLAPDDLRHGTAGGYNNHGCRCDRCREAMRGYLPSHRAQVAWRRRNGMEPRRQGRTHGLRATYVHGCRCDECRRAERTYKNRYRQERRAS